METIYTTEPLTLSQLTGHGYCELKGTKAKKHRPLWGWGGGGVVWVGWMDETWEKKLNMWVQTKVVQYSPSGYICILSERQWRSVCIAQVWRQIAEFWSQFKSRTIHLTFPLIHFHTGKNTTIIVPDLRWGRSKSIPADTYTVPGT